MELHDQTEQLLRHKPLGDPLIVDGLAVARMVWSEGEELEGFQSGLEGVGDLGATRMASRGCTSEDLVAELYLPVPLRMTVATSVSLTRSVSASATHA